MATTALAGRRPRQLTERGGIPPTRARRRQVAEAASDPELAATLRERILGPWRSELAARLASEPDRLAVPVEAALDMLAGPIHHRAVIVGDPVDDARLDAVVGSITPTRAPTR